MSILQNSPHLLEVAYDLTQNMLQPLKPLLKPGGTVEQLFVAGERATKGAIFNCQMCGECVLHSTGMTCPMNCPKNLRNGPCGGVRTNGHCEVKPEMRCVWVEAYERSQHMPDYGADMRQIVAPLNRQLQGSSAWINEVSGVAGTHPAGWKT